MLSLLLVWSGLLLAQPARDPELGEFRPLVRASDPSQARRILNTRIRRAVASGDKTTEMYNRYILGGLAQRWGRNIEAGRELDQARTLAESLKLNWLAGRIRMAMAEIAKAKGMTRKADGILAARSASAPAAADAVSMVMVARLETDASERIGLLQEALQALRTAKPPNPRRQAALLQEIGLTCMAAADYRCALERTQEAAVLFDRVGAKRRLMDLLRTQGTLHLEHGHYREAEEVYRRAWQGEIQLEDRVGAFQTQAMLGVALAKLGKREEALELLQKTLDDLLKATKSVKVRFALMVVAIGYSEIGEHLRAVKIFERLQEGGRLTSMASGHLAGCYFHLGRYSDAIDAATKGFGERSTDPDEDGNSRDSRSLWWRAKAREKLGETEDALQDAINALAVLEQAREHLVQTDFMKRGFAAQGKEVVDFAVELSFRLNRHAEGLAVAEQSRGRAFLDLLASREGGAQPTPPTSQDWKRLNRFLSRLPDTGVVSDTYSKPVSVEQMVETAKRLGSMILAYWVTPDSVYTWLLDSQGRLHTAREQIKEGELRVLIDRVRKRSDTVDRAAWRRLHAVLIEPVRAALPKSNALLTVIPHGPLFDLPFAALAGASGRYFVEDFRLHYVPSASMLEFTKTGTPPEPRRYLVVADPAKLPTLPGGKPLPPLPASRREARAIVSSVPAASVSLLQGSGASLQAVRDAAPSASVLHFATHAVIQADRPLESFLALADGQRLSAADIYELSLPASLVVLSACRSAVGPISSDGVLGLTRAFFVAGASSVIASVWDVPDEPASQLMAEFYGHLKTSGNPSESLRAAQVKIIQRLREGKLTVGTPGGPAVLPEHPLLWAGFGLMGEPRP